MGLYEKFGFFSWNVAMETCFGLLGLYLENRDSYTFKYDSI